MRTLSERIAWILETQQISARELARKAGFHGSEVSTLLKRLEGDPEAVTLRTLRALADGAGVSLAWLAVGEDQTGPHVATDPSPSRTEAANVAHRGGVWGEAVRSVLADELRPGDAALPPEWWLLRMRQREIEMIQEALKRHRASPINGPASAPAILPWYGEALPTGTDADQPPIESVRIGTGSIDDTMEVRRDELEAHRAGRQQKPNPSESGVVVRRDVEELKRAWTAQTRPKK
jgi:transcriptional regulator with XRE-family HTH domain